MTRRQWIERLRTCDEGDLPYLTAMFQDWRQEVLGEDPEPLQFESDMLPARWFREGPKLVAMQPVRHLTEVFAHYFRSTILVDHYCFGLNWEDDEYLPPSNVEACRLWIPNYNPSAWGFPTLSYTPAQGCDTYLVLRETNRRALLWAVEESWKLEGDPPYTTPRDFVNVVNGEVVKG